MSCYTKMLYMLQNMHRACQSYPNELCISVLENIQVPTSINRSVKDQPFRGVGIEDRYLNRTNEWLPLPHLIEGKDHRPLFRGDTPALSSVSKGFKTLGHLDILNWLPLWKVVYNTTLCNYILKLFISLWSNDPSVHSVLLVYQHLTLMSTVCGSYCYLVW